MLLAGINVRGALHRIKCLFSVGELTFYTWQNFNSVLGREWVIIHPKSEKLCGFNFSVQKKIAEKVRKSQRQIFTIKVRKSSKL